MKTHSRGSIYILLQSIYNTNLHPLLFRTNNIGGPVGGKMSRDKGARGELEVAHLLTDAGLSARRGVQHKGGPDSPDVICPAIDDDFQIEVKRTETLSIYPVLDKAEEDAGPLKDAIVFHKRNGKRWVSFMEASVLIELLRKAGYGDN